MIPSCLTYTLVCPSGGKQWNQKLNYLIEDPDITVLLELNINLNQAFFRILFSNLEP